MPTYRSYTSTQGRNMAGARALWRATGTKDEDINKPIIAIPAVFLTGSVFCMLCDLIARTLFSPVEMAIGTVTSIIGAPIVIVLLIKRNRKSE